MTITDSHLDAAVRSYGNGVGIRDGLRLVLTEFAAGLSERERVLQAGRDLYAADSQRMAARVAELEAERDALRLDGIHSCHDKCQRITCVQQRRIATLEAERADIALAVRWAPSSAHWHRRLVELLGADVWQGWDAMSARADAAECERNHLREAIERACAPYPDDEIAPSIVGTLREGLRHADAARTPEADR